MTPFHIRQATWADVPELNQLITESARHLNAANYTPAQVNSVIQHAYGVDSQLIFDGTYYVAEVNGRLVGCGGWSKRKTLYGNGHLQTVSDHTGLLDPRTDSAKIRAFFVHPQFARQGIGRALLTVAEANAHRAGFARLELIATLTGEPLYAAVGFAAQERYDMNLPDGTLFPVTRMTKTAVSAKSVAAELLLV
ncbi:MAG TPA: GNAT family N-acetyltransferase [Chloroflexota bacterium]|nr:GNAT family N-acetyltransferase [Chloroflexota bacterium]